MVLGIVLGIGALLGAAGGVMRIAEYHLRGLSLPDDHFAVWLTTLFITLSGLGLISEAFIVPMYIVAAVTFVYIPLGKIRHCLYFFFSRIFFGKFFGRRAVFPHSVDEVRAP
jgi:H+/gluconate symporter-like permease